MQSTFTSISYSKQNCVYALLGAGLLMIAWLNSVCDDRLFIFHRFTHTTSAYIPYILLDMGGAVSSGRDNEELVDNLCHEGYIHEPRVEQVLTAGGTYVLWLWSIIKKDFCTRLYDYKVFAVH